jgi:hypothetical protein
MSITPNFLPPSLLVRLRRDASKLYQAGSFCLGTMIGGTKEQTDKRYRKCDVCDLCDNTLSDGVGEVEARNELFEVVGHLRFMIESQLHRPLVDSMELQYLRLVFMAETVCLSHHNLN